MKKKKARKLNHFFHKVFLFIYFRVTHLNEKNFKNQKFHLFFFFFAFYHRLNYKKSVQKKCTSSGNENNKSLR